MSKHNNVNPNFYKIGGREHTDGADKGDIRGNVDPNAPAMPGQRQSKKK
jgi:hypothetical protein